MSERHQNCTIHRGGRVAVTRLAGGGFGIFCAALMLAVSSGCSSEPIGPRDVGTSVGGSTGAQGGGAATAGTAATGGTVVEGGGGGAAATAGVAAGTGGGAGGGPLDVGTKVIHRLSPVEYDNTTRHLLGTSQNLGNGVEPEIAEGFDNIAEAQSMSPRHVEHYFKAARDLTDIVFADTALRDRILTCAPDAADMSCAQAVISNFGLRAFRRPLEPSEEQLLLEQYQAALSLEETPEGALAHVVRFMLASPQFLYRIEFDPNPADPTPHPLSPYELASRLSYALWSSMPDDTLFSLAASAELSQPEVLGAQVDRMLADARAEMLSKNFASQWFGLRRLDEHAPDPEIYPGFSEELASAMQQEVELYFTEFLTQDLPYQEFLTADFNFVNAALAEHYGMAPPAGAGFSRVVDTSDQRQGLIGLSGFLTHTSRPRFSSPIIRGDWILKSFWCVQLKVPDTLVIDELPDPTTQATPTTVRELMAAHRTEPVCSGCHNLIDPVGLALEHFDGIGRYRTQYENGREIDSVGDLPGGVQVDGLASLSSALTADPQFLPCAARKLNTYALGRTDTSQAHLNEIVQAWTAGPATLRNLIKQTVTHPTFTTRRADVP